MISRPKEPHHPMDSPRAGGLFLGAILEQVFQFAHELLHILEVHVHDANLT